MATAGNIPYTTFGTFGSSGFQQPKNPSDNKLITDSNPDDFSKLKVYNNFSQVLQTEPTMGELMIHAEKYDEKDKTWGDDAESLIKRCTKSSYELTKLFDVYKQYRKVQKK